MTAIQLTDDQIVHLRDVLQREIEHLSVLVDGSVHPDDADDQHRKSVLCGILASLSPAGREYRIAYAAGGGEWDVVDTFTATDDDAANTYAEATYSGDEWYVLDADNRNINGGRDQA
jgi:hypothetical protein